MKLNFLLSSLMHGVSAQCISFTEVERNKMYFLSSICVLVDSVLVYYYRCSNIQCMWSFQQ